MPAHRFRNPPAIRCRRRGRLSLVAAGLVCLLGATACEGMTPQPHETPQPHGSPGALAQEVGVEPLSRLAIAPDPATREALEKASTPRAVDAQEAPRPVLPKSDIPDRRPGRVDSSAAAPAAGGGAFAGWKTYRMGRSSFRYPRDWSVQNTAYGVLLTPAGSKSSDELIVVTAQSAPGVQRGTDARVGAALDAMITSAMPAMRRKGRPQEVVASIGSGGRFDYAGRAPDGRQAEGSVYVAVESGKAAAISIVADRRRLEERRANVERIFQSFESGDSGRGKRLRSPATAAGELDPRLIGMFAGEATHSGGGVRVSTRLVYTLGADGVLHYGAQSAMNASQGNGAGGFRWTASGMSEGKLERGTWSASEGQLTVEWDSGKVGTVAYGFEPDGTLALRDPFTRKLINIYDRVQ